MGLVHCNLNREFVISLLVTFFSTNLDLTYFFTLGRLRVISFPGGQQFGAISPCEMNEFSDECEVWEKDNGPYVKAEYMVKSNSRTKGR